MSGTSGTRGATGTGNAKSVPEKRETPNLHYSFRVNASKINAEQLEEILVPRCERFVFQMERGEEKTEKNPDGYLHYQGCLSLLTRSRWSSILKLFPLGTQLEHTKSISGAWEYCTKEESRVEGPWVKGELPTKKKKEVEELDLIVPDRDWQVRILKILSEKPDNRTIYWFWESNGGIGKTQFCKYVVVKLGALYVDGCKKADILYAASEKKCNTILIDIMRDDEEIPYRAMEAIKNGIFFCSKYESKTVVRDSPHVIVFANRPPDTGRLSSDRWKIEELKPRSG